MKKFFTENWKQALMSIFVGAVVAFLTTLLQGVLEWLRNIPTEAVASSGGVLHYAVKHIKIL